jgi:hypothetical protein
MLVRCFLVAFSLAVVSTVAADDTKKPVQVDNPEYLRWARFAPGTSTTAKNVQIFGKTTTQVMVTTTLVSKDDNKLVLKTEMTHTVNGKVSQTPPTTRDVPKQTTLPEGTTKEEFAKPMPGAKEEGKETLKIDGVEYKCVIYRQKFTAKGTDVDWKMWICEDVPGWMVKTVNSGKNNVVSASTFDLISVKKP